LVAIAIAVPLLSLTVIAAFSLPQTKAARVPGPAVVSPFASAKGVAERIVVARIDSVDLLLPVRGEATTAVAFHPVDNTDAIALTPVGERGDAGGVATRLSEVFSSGGGTQYYQMDGNGSDGSADTAGLDVGAVPGVFVYAPADGKVVSIKDYDLLGRYPDTEIQIRLADDPSVLLVMTHISRTSVGLGDEVAAGETALGRLRRFPPAVDQGIKQFTTDNGDHVQLIALRTTSQLSDF
jgi:hypothetical protein